MDIIFSDDQDDPLSSEALPTGSVLELAESALVAEGLPSTTQLAIALVDAARMAELNLAHMGKTGPTDVLSFPIEDFAGGMQAAVTDGPPLLLGDILICPEVVQANAATSGVAFDDEMALMVVHGILHLLGRDHVIESEAEAMEQRESEILALVGRERP